MVHFFGIIFLGLDDSAGLQKKLEGSPWVVGKPLLLTRFGCTESCFIQDHFELGLAMGQAYQAAIRERVAAHAPRPTQRPLAALAFPFYPG